MPKADHWTEGLELFQSTVAPLEVTVYRSEIDNVLVIEIDTPGLAGDDVENEVPRLRIYLNDGSVWGNPPQGG